MALTWNLYDKFRVAQCGGGTAINFSGLTVKCMIVTNSYTPDQALHDFRDDLGANEVSGTNYTAGGNTVSPITVTPNTSTGLITVDGTDPATWAQSATGFSNGRRAILYVARGGASTADELIAYSSPFETSGTPADKGNVDGDFTVQFDAAGIFESAR